MLELDRVLLHNAKLASGWNAMFGAIRSETSLPESIREVAICWVAVLNKAEYEWIQHAPLAIEGGLSEQIMDELHKGDSSSLDDSHKLVVEYTTAMTRNIEPGQQLFDRIQNEFGTTGAVELTATIAGYNMVSRFLVALKVGE